LHLPLELEFELRKFFRRTWLFFLEHNHFSLCTKSEEHHFAVAVAVDEGTLGLTEVTEANDRSGIQDQSFV
jgi:hypothetical protein